MADGTYSTRQRSRKFALPRPRGRWAENPAYKAGFRPINIEVWDGSARQVYARRPPPRIEAETRSRGRRSWQVPTVASRRPVARRPSPRRSSLSSARRLRSLSVFAKTAAPLPAAKPGLAWVASISGAKIEPQAPASTARSRIRVRRSPRRARARRGRRPRGRRGLLSSGAPPDYRQRTRETSARPRESPRVPDSRGRPTPGSASAGARPRWASERRRTRPGCRSPARRRRPCRRG